MKIVILSFFKFLTKIIFIVNFSLIIYALQLENSSKTNKNLSNNIFKKEKDLIQPDIIPSLNTKNEVYIKNNSDNINDDVHYNRKLYENYEQIKGFKTSNNNADFYFDSNINSVNKHYSINGELILPRLIPNNKQEIIISHHPIKSIIF